MNEPVSIIILNYNGKQFLNECLTSVLHQTYTYFEIIFFDNNSSDGSANYVKQQFSNSGIKIIQSPENLGFAGGNNEAIKHAVNDLIVLLNNDTQVEQDWLHHLVHALENKNSIASSFVITEGIDKKYYESNGSLSYLMYNIMNVFEDIYDEFYPNGCSVIFRKSEIGVPFDSDYFYYSEDVYLGLKARFMGMKVKFVRDSVVHHYGGGSNSGTAQRTYFQERNRLLNLYTFFSLWFLIRVYPYVLLNEFVKFIYSIFSPKYSFTGIIKANLWICFHIPTIIRKRKSIKSVKKLHEKEVIKYMSSKIINGNGFINKISYLYSRLVGIKPVEYFNLNQDLKD